MSAYPHHVVKWKCAKTLLADSSANVNKEPHLTTTQSVLILTSVRKPPVPQMEFVLILSSVVVTAVPALEATLGTAIRHATNPHNTAITRNKTAPCAPVSS